MQYDEGLSAKLFYLNGLSTTTGGSMRKNTLSNLRIGAGTNDNAASEFFDGDIGEVILYAESLNQAQRVLVSNFLSAKYDYRLSGNDLYCQDNGDNGDFDFEVAGIGRLSEADIHADAQGSGMVRVRNPRGMDDGEFLIWGHQNGDAHATEFFDVPTGVEARFGREWRVSEVTDAGSADVGAVDIRWDLGGLGPVTAEDLRLLVDTVGNGKFSLAKAIGGATALGDNIYQFSGVTALRDSARFTLATANASQTALPVDLLYFEASLTEAESVHLDWETVQENESDYFTVEKSRDGSAWLDVGTVDATGAVRRRAGYAATDVQPYPGISYYRLRLTDFSGNHSYSRIRRIHLATPSALRAYPNPAANHVILEGTPESLRELRVFNALGQEVTSVIRVTNRADDALLLDISGLPTGLYALHTKHTSLKLIKR